MRKRLITPTPKTVRTAAEDWLDLEHAAAVEVTSEEEGFPVESALLLGETRGWRAASSGAQILGLVFDQPQTFKRISLVFEEEQTERKLEFALAMVFRQRALISRNCAPAVELQPTRHHPRGRGIPGRPPRCQLAGTDRGPSYQWRTGSCLAQKFAPPLILPGFHSTIWSLIRRLKCRSRRQHHMSDGSSPIA